MKRDGSNMKTKMFSDFELHEGWIEQCRNEKKSLIQSIKKSMQYGYAKDQKRAQQILDIELDDEQEEDDVVDYNFRQENFKSPQNLLSDRLKKEHMKLSERKLEMAFEDNINQLRSDYYLALDEKKLGLTKKKLFTKSNTRCLQSKINLKFPIKDMLQDKPKAVIPIKEGVVEEFEKKYKEMCNQQYQRVKNRNVSPTSPFDKNNMPPIQMENNYAFSSNPTKLNPKDIDISKMPLAGRISDIGQKILTLGGKKAQFITTMNWGVGHPNKDEQNKESNDNETVNQSYGKFLNNSPITLRNHQNDGSSKLPQIMTTDTKRHDRYYTNRQSKNQLNESNFQSPNMFSTEKLRHLENSPNGETLNSSSVNKQGREDYLRQAKEQRKVKFLQRILKKRESLTKSVRSRQQEITVVESTVFSGRTQERDEKVYNRRKLLEKIMMKQTNNPSHLKSPTQLLSLGGNQ